ncbi:hypothetical protein L6452_05268 [Arctium lappa]|uniref:Uncharacterized protein n=1 Tax=Arctium lappa TaxID=4217 RepID=A0ACB9EFX4_ARCLA|nr:hypothetical protein L6452_05268 [Arctium lappa]
MVGGPPTNSRSLLHCQPSSSVHLLTNGLLHYPPNRFMDVQSFYGNTKPLRHDMNKFHENLRHRSSVIPENRKWRDWSFENGSTTAGSTRKIGSANGVLIVAPQVQDRHKMS